MEAKVCEEEIIGLRLYTGPLFCKLNAVLRNKGKTEGNNYSNVIHAILSGIAKLSQVSGIPAGRRVYRGVGGMRLPACFYVPNDKGVLGGAERAFMSTTTNRDVAIYVRVRACALRAADRRHRAPLRRRASARTDPQSRRYQDPAGSTPRSCAWG